ncbi:PAS domain S-box protein [Sulfurimonas autotrophica]|uniref:Signal transduction histidine kinase with CheB and CheR activity n=1 Tax=Sulfurimonas autotrophica (strain ATCC BAA-671 / DSM 16294 / JCM 11897 / OK10) TaxID=563040 RepID=E0USU0_SULAO|nr:PAS domain S-box protein [Sulfurimonas autotrophica]ADN08117.1 signal transduction histidine kinase with CheB and CheR activity [Sulfurimonas autotrophica DSM 16294]
MKDSVFIGIGASAGGLEALKELLPLLPQDEGYVYIIAQHLDPHKKSALGEILTAYTAMPVVTISQKYTFLPNSVNIVPPGYNLTYAKHKLLLEKISKTPHTPTPSVDELFKALSSYKKENCVGIVLSGAGHDATAGVKTIKENGGITVAQSPDEAQYADMPKNAIQSGYIDYVLKVAQIGENLESIIHIMPEPLMKITKLLEEKECLDIDKYKKETIMRRLNKRMMLTKCADLDEYFDYIQTHPDELYLLYQNILIGVTEFFRDKESFEVFKQHLEHYLLDKPDHYDLRIWSIACSTGEEAYSLAIIIDQIKKKLKKNFSVHIFATDIDEKALEIAKKGIYTKKLLEKIDKKIIKTYFSALDEGYKIKEFIRSQIVFTKHNILSDPPFIKQDIISCRNFLIYILPEVQQELFVLFHYALKDKGLLFLGSSESTLMSVDYFKALNQEHKVYVKEALQNPPRISSHYFSSHINTKQNQTGIKTSTLKDINIKEEITNTVFELFSHECIIVDTNFTIVYKQGSNPFLELGDGFVTLNIVENLKKELRYSVKKILKRTLKTATLHSTKFIEVKLDNKEQTFVKVIAAPFANKQNTPFILLYFQELNAHGLEFDTREIVLPNESYVVENLTNRVKELQEDYHALLDELSISKENMQLLNEELQRSNEELQSANEELETSNEELQSSNEELQVSIINEQKLQRQLALILNSTHDGIMGLDLEGRHTFVNAAALEMLGYTKDELLGKNAHRIWHHTKPDGSHYLFSECTLHTHLVDGLSVRKEDFFFKKDSTGFNVEVLQNPIIEEGKVKGAVLSFRDITEKKKLQQEAEYEHRLANLYVNTTGTLVMVLDLAGSVNMINNSGCELLGLPKEKIIGKNFIHNFIPKARQPENQNVFDSLISEKTDILKEYKNIIIDAQGKEHIISWRNNYIKDDNGTLTSLLSSGIDITDKEALTEKLFEQEHLYKLTFEEADIGIAHVSLDGRWIDTNEYLSKLLGYTKEEFQNMHVFDITFPQDRDTDMHMIEQLHKGEKKSYHIEKRYVHKNGNIIWVSLAVVLLLDEQKKPLYLLKIIRDISQLKLLMYQIEIEKNRFQRIIEFTPIPTMLYNTDGDILILNKIFQDNTGYTLEEIPTIDKMVEKLFVNEDADSIKSIKQYYKEPTKLPKQQQCITTKSKERRVGILDAVKLDEEGNSSEILYLIAIVDITDIQKKDELMVAQSRQAAMGDMLSMIAHQWRQPLSVISMVANNIQAQIELQRSVDAKSLHDLIHTLNEQTQYLSHTIDDFRNFFKPDKNREFIKIDVILEKLTHLIEKSLQNNAISLTLPKKSDIELCTYQNQLLQVLINIINNAKDAIKEHRAQDGNISIDVIKKKKEILLKICDNGGGIKPEILKKLGEPYVTSKSKNGTGLGIYMSRIIVEKHLGGRLSWESNSKGSCFYISLPKDTICES